MKKTATTIILLFFTLLAFSQSNRKVDAQGNFLWQWHRSVAILEAENTLAVTYVFINGVKQQAIAYRQEHFFSDFNWKDTTDGIPFTDKNIEGIHANLAPNSAISWTFLLKGNTLPELENAAIIYIDENYEISKEKIKGCHY